MKKLTAFLFIVVALVITFFYVRENFDFQKKEDTQVSPVFMIEEEDDVTEEKESEVQTIDNSTMFAYIPLRYDETLLQTYPVSITANYATDEIEDQVCAVRKAGSQLITLVLALYNKEYSSYYRAMEIPTKVSRVNTLSVSAEDIVGNHQKALSYSGFSDDHKTVMQIFQSDYEDNNTDNISFLMIGDFVTDGTITIAEAERSEDYSRRQTAGTACTIVETRPATGSANALDQIQIEYRYNQRTRSYEQASESRIPGKTVNAQEIKKILDGTTATFSSFLNGLWCKTENDSNGLSRFMFFNPIQKEVICLFDDTQEIFSWDSDWLRSNGMSISTANASVSAVTRRFDITLVGLDEIRIRSTDTVGMTISEESLWDGNYKKMTNANGILLQPEVKKVMDTTELAELLEPTDHIWITQDNYLIRFTKQHWTAEKNGVTSSGIFALSIVLSQPVIEFRSNVSNPRFDGCYLVSTENTTDDYDVLTLQPVIQTAEKLVATGDYIRLDREKEKAGQ